MAGIAPGSIKICSLREPAHARAVLDAGADLYGLIFVPGAWRQVSIDQAAAIIAEMRAGAAGRLPRAVGVFVDASAEEINATALAVGLDLVQLHGNEPPEMLAELRTSAFKAIRPEPETPIAEIERTLARYAEANVAPIAFLIDGFRLGSRGGEGVRANWEVAAQLARRWPLMLAGGLAPDNVAEAIRTVGPLAVDVSSGVETDKQKDPAKMAAFAASARAAFAARSANG